MSEKNANGKRGADAIGEWRGERRSTRLGTNPDISDYGPPKRQRTEERSSSSAPSDSLESPVLQTNGTTNSNGVKKIKDGEIAVEQVAGKKKSKFWFYAVEPSTAGTVASVDDASSAGVVTSPGTANGDAKADVTIKAEEVVHKPNGLKTEEPVLNGMNGHGTKPPAPNESHDRPIDSSNGVLNAVLMKAEIGA